LLLSGCSAEKPAYSADSLHDMLRPKEGMAKLAVYYPTSRIWSGTVADVTVEGAEACRLRSGSFMLRDIPPGKTPVFISLCNGNGVTRMMLYADAGQTYFLQVVPYDKSVSGLIAGHGLQMTENPPENESLHLPPKLTGAALEANERRKTHAEGTAFYLDRMEEPYALKQMESLQLVKE
jgi:hypothetical protein